MLQDEYAAFLSGRDWLVQGRGVFAVWGGLPFQVNFAPSGRGAAAFLFRLEGRPDRAGLKALGKGLPRGWTLTVPRAGCYHLVCNGAKLRGARADFSAVLDQTVRALRELGLTVPDRCPLCSRPGCNALAAGGGLGEGYLPVHRACVEGRNRTVQERAAHNEASGSYITGFLGALLGGIVGTLPTVLIILFAQRIYALLFALIPICAYYGYQLLGGRMDRGAFVCTLVSSVFNLFSIHFLTNYISLCQALGRAVSLWTGLGMYADAVASGSITGNLIQSGLFLLLGLWFSWRVITRTGRQQAHQAAAAADTLRPLDGVVLTRAE